MSDSDGAKGRRGHDDAGAARPSARKDAESPKAVPRPSQASEGKPVPKPVRPAPGVADAPSAKPVPSKASRDAPVPRPVRRPSPEQAPPAPAKPVQETPGTLFAAGAATPAGRREDVAPAASAPERSIFSSVTKPKPPATTQAIKTGPGKARKLEFTKHTIRGEDRVNIKEDIDVAYRFLGPSGPDQYPDAHRGKLVDISLTGAQIEGILPDDPPKEDLLSGTVLVHSKMELPFVETPLVIDSQVSWVKPADGGASQIGLRFAGLTQQQGNLIRAFFIGLQSPTRNKFRRGRS